MEKRVIDNLFDSWKIKYAMQVSPEIRDCFLLTDTMVLKFLDSLNDETANILASLANVHPTYIGKLMVEYDKEVQEINAQKMKENPPVFDKNTVKDLTKEETIETVEKMMENPNVKDWVEKISKNRPGLFENKEPLYEDHFPLPKKPKGRKKKSS